MDAKQEVTDHFRISLVRIRKRAALSQEELAELAGLHRTEIGMLERGIRLPRIDTLVKLAGALEVEAGELLEGLTWIPAGPALGRFRVGKEDANEAKPEGKAAREASQEEP